jgi:hypothetical protein
MHSVEEIFAEEAGVEQIANGFRIRQTEEYVIEVWAMLFNWRLVVMRPNQQVNVDRGFCYFGRGLEALSLAVVAGLEWEDPYGTDPKGYGKKAFG